MKSLSGLQYAVLLSRCLVKADDIATPWRLDIPPAPQVGAKTVDPALISYSIEFANFHDFTGNSSNPNALSTKLLQNLADITGAYPEIRIGGTTANHATFVASQEQPILLNFTTPGADQPTSLTWGPSWLDLFKNLPADIQYTIGLTFNFGQAGTAETVAEAVEVYSRLNKTLYAFEIGNEFDSFPVDRNASTWNIEEFTREWTDRVKAVRAAINGASGPSQTGPFFQTGTFTAPRSLSSTTNWTFETLVGDGILDVGNVRAYSGHQYFGAACAPVPPTLDNVLNHTIIAGYMDIHANESALAAKLGVDYNIGETNSIACQGMVNVSDVFAAALWSVDYSLYAASLNVSRLYYHSGVGYRYAAWQPRQNGTTAPGPRPLYYGHLFVADVIQGGNKQVRQLYSQESLVAYGIYNKAAEDGRAAQLQHVVIVNLQKYTGTGTRPSIKAQLALDGNGASPMGSAKVRRLMAPSITAKEGITWAGKTVDVDGFVRGEDSSTDLQDGAVDVPASEAVLVSFHV